MEKFFRRLILIQLLFSVFLFSQARAQIITIPLSNGQSISIEETPDVAQMKSALGLSVTDAVRKKIESKGGVITDVDPMNGWKNLTSQEQKDFSNLRIKYLTQVVKILDKMHGLIGMGIVTGNAIKFTVQKTKSLFVKPAEATGSEKKELLEQKRALIESIARGIDYKMWFQAPLLINANEFGVQASAGIIGLGGFMRNGGGGVEEIGLSLSYNKDEKAFVFEIFHNGERFDNAAMPAFNVGINGKANVLMKSVSRTNPNSLSEGSTFYPPAFPGSTSYGPDMYAAGFSTGIGFPPPPIGDLLTFTNKYKRTALIRVTVSPLVKGFIRVRVGDLRVPVKSILYRFVDIFNGVKNLFSKKETAPKIITDDITNDRRQPQARIYCEGMFGI